MTQTTINERSGLIQLLTPGITAPVQISLRRTRRLLVGDRDQVHNLPPDLGPAQVASVADFADRLPSEIVTQGGIMVPMQPEEAFWLDFRKARTYRPSVIMIAAGKVNALTGEYWSEQLAPAAIERRLGVSGSVSTAQNYLHIGGKGPTNPWLDGWRTADGKVRQFVCAERGCNTTVEGQITGAEHTGGIQILFMDAHLDMFPTANRPQPMAFGGEITRCSVIRSAAHLGDIGARSTVMRSMGVAAGAQIRQELVPSPYPLVTWDPTATAKIFVHLIAAQDWIEITGRGRAQVPDPLAGLIPIADPIVVGAHVKPKNYWQCGCNDIGTVRSLQKLDDIDHAKVSTGCGNTWVPLTDLTSADPNPGIKSNF